MLGHDGAHTLGCPARQRAGEESDFEAAAPLHRGLSSEAVRLPSLST
jgi:hypothetical protein